MFRWLTTNFRIFFLAFILALAVWLTAVTAANPDETQVYPDAIPIEFIGQNPGLIVTDSVIPQQVEVTLRAPHSVWQELLSDASSLRAVADLTGLASGTHSVVIQVQVNARPVRILSVNPASINLSLEAQVTRSIGISLALTGNPATGYQAGNPLLDPARVTLTGAVSVVSQIDQIRATLDLADARQNISASLPLQAVDADGMVISRVSVIPDTVQVNIPVILQGGYRDLAVKVVTTGNPASGYSLTSVAALPPIVTVYSANSLIIDSMPGYVETSSLDLTDASRDIEKHLAIILPSGVTLIGDQSVLVKVGISPIESSRKYDFRPVEMIGLALDLVYHVSPQTVDVILSGPLPELDALVISDIHVQLDLTGMGPGTYQLTPVVSFPSQDITVESILPQTVEVTITTPATPSP
jgi:YbbR domain-containing protein